ncbi:uncharacterized protein N7459_009674 [Penicillium hispanicum]|uniref:uncharacterized protein n=1 Tax=Penicillium hispanicum TaxID=1080232 RepID=UPI002541FCEC|nr:uncharacterized protein N7459_009674 [Penicillium hispanicum]KAJ5570244.1 hypothetical protein N7459_009674 [Penicillium hispanicum]
MASSLPPRTGPTTDLSPPASPNTDRTEPRDKKSPDPNMSNPRLLVNRACIYERRLPGNAYITAHVQRLQHGYYSSPAVSDKDAEHVDFLAVSFVFHASQTLKHRFKSATIRAGIHGPCEISNSAFYPSGYPPGNPRFLMHAPHLIYGTVSPETMEWTFSLAGSLGISETPVSASLIPSGSVNGRYRRYEMMRIQGSARTLKSARGPQFDVEAGEIVWSLEENNLQRSGLPREFTFVMLIQKPTETSAIRLSLDIDPVLQTWYGSYPNWMLSLPAYQPSHRWGVNFRQEVGQRFEPSDAKRGFNFAALESSFDDYIAMPGRKFTRQIEIPPDTFPRNNNFPRSYPGEYGSLNPMQQLQNNGLSLQNDLLHPQLHQLQQQVVRGAPDPSTSAATGETGAGAGTNTFNVRLLVDNAVPSNVPASSSSPSRTQYLREIQNTTQASGLTTEDIKPVVPVPKNGRFDTHSVVSSPSSRDSSDPSSGWLAGLRMDDSERAHVTRGKVHSEEEPCDVPGRARLKRTSHSSRQPIMLLANVPLSQTLLTSLFENSH